MSPVNSDTGHLTNDDLEFLARPLLGFLSTAAGPVQILVDRRLPAGSPGLGRLAEHVLTALEQGGITGVGATRAF